MKKLIALIIALALLAVACGGDDDDVSTEEPASEPAAQSDGSSSASTGASQEPADDDQPEPEDDEGDGPSSGSNSALCALGAEYDGTDPFDGVSILNGEEFFEVADDLWDQVEAAAPGEVRDDVATIRGGLDDLERVLEEHDYDFLNEDLQQGIEGIDTTAMDEASASFASYMNDVCGIDFDAGTPDQPGPAAAPPMLDPEELQNLDADDPVAILQAVFGIDAELAQCLSDELGGLDLDNVDNAVLTQQVCGTTLLEVMSGVGG